jgi:hypothetical protein
MFDLPEQFSSGVYYLAPEHARALELPISILEQPDFVEATAGQGFGHSFP